MASLYLWARFSWVHIWNLDSNYAIMGAQELLLCSLFIAYFLSSQTVGAINML